MKPAIEGEKKPPNRQEQIYERNTPTHTHKRGGTHTHIHPHTNTARKRREPKDSRSQGDREKAEGETKETKKERRQDTNKRKPTSEGLHGIRQANRPKGSHAGSVVTPLVGITGRRRKSEGGKEWEAAAGAGSRRTKSLF